MKVSVIVVTRNSGGAIRSCLDSIAAAIRRASLSDAEIAVADNGSTDDTTAVIEGWIPASPVPVIFLSEPRPGRARALNRALRATTGDLIACTDDDCRLHEAYIADLLRHDGADTGLVLRGGRIELGDPTDLPFTVFTGDTPLRWSRAMNSARRENIPGRIAGCNMTYRRALYERIGPWDEAFGPGSRIGSGDDSDYIYRAYLAGALLEYVPDMAVYHYHGRKTDASIRALFRRYMIGQGALTAKYLLKHPDFCRGYLWDLRNAAKEVIGRSNTFQPSIGFSHRDKVKYATLGCFRYVFGLADAGTAGTWDNERRKSPLQPYPTGGRTGMSSLP